MHPLEAAFRARQHYLANAATEIAIRRGFLSEDERFALRDWAFRMRPLLHANGIERAYLKTDQLPALPEVYTKVRHRLQHVLGLDGFEQEPMFGWYLSIIGESGAVHGHLDPTPAGYRHLRCNMFLQVPSSGGHPVIEGKVYPVRDGDLLAFFPSEKRHRSQEVKGDLARILCSFGYLAPLTYQLPSFSGEHRDSNYAPDHYQAA